MRSEIEAACPEARVRVGRSPLHGRGLFASQAVRKGELVMENHALPLDPGELPADGVLARYCFEWPFDGDGRAIVLGEASFLNHAPGDEGGKQGPNGGHLRANLVWETDKAADVIRFYAKRDIQAGEELLIDYGEDYPWGDHA